MEDFLLNPVLWIGLVAVVVVVVIISLIINQKRAKEVKELDQLFPEGSLSHENLEKIPVEKVRRSTMDRERKKKEREQKIPKKLRPKEGTKVFEEEDQEFIMTNVRKRQTDGQPLMPRKNTETPKRSTSSYVRKSEVKPEPESDSQYVSYEQQLASTQEQEQQQQTTPKYSRRRPSQAQQQVNEGVRDAQEVTEHVNSTVSRSQSGYTTRSEKKPRSRSDRYNPKRYQKADDEGLDSSTEKQATTRSRVGRYTTKKKKLY